MAFKFDWNIEGDDEQTDQDTITPPSSTKIPLKGLEDEVSHLTLANAGKKPDVTCQEVSLDSLVENLPPVMSYSTIEVPLTHDGKPTGETAQVLRRDLFDARFQLANIEDDSDDEGSGYGNLIPRSHSPTRGLGFSRENTDLIRGVYEGGLKTWEASLDLVDCLKDQGFEEGKLSIQGKSLLEVGCGTALPTVYLLEQLFRQLLQSTPSQGSTKEKTTVHLQDYNSEVLLYITFCNIILAYWNAKQSAAPTTEEDSTASSSESTLPVSKVSHSKSETAISNEVAYTAEDDSETELNELPLPEEFIESFLSFLNQYNIELKFFSGGWQSFPKPAESYDIILTSETVYELENLDDLCDLLHTAATIVPRKEEQLTLVACKRVYFGVGGGELAFKEKVESRAEVSNIWNSQKGVERTIMRVQWN